MAAGTALDAGAVAGQPQLAGSLVADSAPGRAGVSSGGTAIGAFGFDISVSPAAEAFSWHSLSPPFICCQIRFHSSRYYGNCEIKPVLSEQVTVACTVPVPVKVLILFSLCHRVCYRFAIGFAMAFAMATVMASAMAF